MAIADNAGETFSLAQARRVAAMLDLDPMRFPLGDPVPRGWHFALLAGETPRRDLRTDGYPGLGLPIPQYGRARLLLGQRSTAFHGDLSIGAPLDRKSSLVSAIEKVGRNGPLTIVTVEHLLSPAHAASPAVTEQQTFYLAGLPQPGTPPAPKPEAPDLPKGGTTKVVTPDEVMLFQYSALGFNTHRIHFDRDYARGVEGHPDLVVNGGLASLLASEFVRCDLSLRLKSLTSRHLAPLYVNRPITIHLTTEAKGVGTILLLDDGGIVAAELAVTFDDL